MFWTLGLAHLIADDPVQTDGDAGPDAIVDGEDERPGGEG